MDAIAKMTGPLVSAHGSLLEGEAAKNASRYREAQLNQNAGQEEASAQRAGEEETRRARLLASRALAVAGASGGGTADVDVINAISGIHSEGKLASMTKLYEGETNAALLRRQAAASIFEGEQALSASKIKAVTTVISGASGMSKSDFNFGGGDEMKEANWGREGKPSYSLSSGRRSSSIGMRG